MENITLIHLETSLNEIVFTRKEVNRKEEKHSNHIILYIIKFTYPVYPSGGHS